MMQRANFDFSGYKQMNVKDFDRVQGTTVRSGRQSRATTGLSPTAAILGVVCALAVLGGLGLLYAFG
jgi:hypothetical protein